MSFAFLFRQKYGEANWVKFKRYAHEIQNKNNIYFKNQELLFKALAVRGSLIPSHEFERLEYLGDSILQAIVGYLLFESFPDFSPEKLTRLRSILVRNQNLAFIGKKMGISKVGIILNLGILNDNQVADMFEAFVGALFLDRGDFETVKDEVKFLFDIENKVEEIQNNPWGDKDPKSFLHELLQKKFKNNFEVEYSSINVGTSNSPLYRVTIIIRRRDNEDIIDYAVGDFARKLKEAQKNAAESLLLKWVDTSSAKEIVYF